MSTPGKLILFFDTETNAIGRMSPPVTQTLMQLAWIITDESGTIQETRNILVRGAKRTGPFCPHTLTPEQVNATGSDPEEVVREFMEAAERVITSGGLLVAHNAGFDVGVLEHAGNCQLSPTLGDAVFCTMRSSDVMSHCNLTNRRGSLKSPKLSELYTVLFGEPPSETLHDALGDTRVLCKSFHKLVQKRVISLPTTPSIDKVYIMAEDISAFCCDGVDHAHVADIASRTLAYFGSAFGVTCMTSFLDLPASNDPVELGKREREMHTAIDKIDADPEISREAKRLVSARLKSTPLYALPPSMGWTSGSTLKYMHADVTEDGGIPWGIIGRVPDVSDDGVLVECAPLTPIDGKRIQMEAHMRVSGATKCILKNITLDPSKQTHIEYTRDDKLWSDAMTACSNFFRHLHALTSDESLMKSWNTRDPVTRQNIWQRIQTI